MTKQQFLRRVTASHIGMRFYVGPTQWLRRKKKILRGVYRTYIRRDSHAYEPASWFDRFYSDGVSDRQTIESDTPALSAQYHYSSVELIISRELLNYRFPVTGATVLDVGSGAGHWLKFYDALGAAKCVGIEASRVACDFLERNVASEKIEIHQGLLRQVLQREQASYDIVNAKGVMFHVVDDSEWLQSLECIANAIRKDGLLVVGGYFGWVDKINVQIDADGSINKRLRSGAHWKRTLRGLGFKKIKICRNPAYLRLKDYVPENHILLAWR